MQTCLFTYVMTEDFDRKSLMRLRDRFDRVNIDKVNRALELARVKMAERQLPEAHEDRGQDQEREGERQERRREAGVSEREDGQEQEVEDAEAER